MNCPIKFIVLKDTPYYPAGTDIRGDGGPWYAEPDGRLVPVVYLLSKPDWYKPVYIKDAP